MMVMNELWVHATQPQTQPASDGFATRSPRIYPEGGEIVREEAEAGGYGRAKLAHASCLLW